MYIKNYSAQSQGIPSILANSALTTSSAISGNIPCTFTGQLYCYLNVGTGGHNTFIAVKNLILCFFKSEADIFLVGIYKFMN